MLTAAAVGSVALVGTTALAPPGSPGQPVGRLLGDLPICGDGSRSRWAWLVGQFLGWCSSGCYLLSRVSQIHQNIERGSVEGLSLSMFLLMIAGNSTYGASILLRAPSLASLKSKAPWLLGSLGCVSLDIFIFLHGRHMERRKARLAVAPEEAEDGGITQHLLAPET